MSHRLQVLIPESLEARLRKAAERLRVSKGEWVRRAIEEALREEGRSHGGSPDPLTRLASLSGPTGDVEQMIEETEAGRS